MAHFSDPRPIDSPLESASDEPRSSLPENKFSIRVDSFIIRISRLCSWFWLATLVVILSNVFMRFFLNTGSIALEELSWHFFGAGLMLTMAYSVITDEHVRVDVLFERFSERTQSWIELVLILLFLFPILFIITWELFEYTYRSWDQGERAASASGLDHRFIIKSAIPIGLSLIILALTSRTSRLLTNLTSWPKKYQS